MKKRKKNRSFAIRLSRWVMLILFIMMSGLSFLIYICAEALMVELGGMAVHSSMLSSEKRIKDVMSDVSVAVENNVFDIERNLNQPDQMEAIVERMVRQNSRIRSCGISFIDNYYPQKGHGFCPYAWRTDSLQVETMQLAEMNGNYLKSQWVQKAVERD